MYASNAATEARLVKAASTEGLFVESERKREPEATTTSPLKSAVSVDVRVHDLHQCIFEFYDALQSVNATVLVDSYMVEVRSTSEFVD